MIERFIVGPLQTNSYIFKTKDKGCYIIDCGGDSTLLVRHITVEELRPKGIILTHGHLDHVADVGLLKRYFKETGVDVPVYIHKEDARFLGYGAEKVHSDYMKQLGIPVEHYFQALDLPLVDADHFLSEGDVLPDTDLQVIYTPGHSKGSICLYSGKEHILFSGDTLFAGSVGRTDTPDGNHQEIITSIIEKLMILPDETRVFSGHGSETAIGEERKFNPFIK